MILIDDRAGSVELSAHLPEALVVRLEYGDVMITGQGPDGEVDVGIERKRIGDLVNSMTSGRLSGHQVPGMLEAYYHSYLIVEGQWKENKCNGELITRRGKDWAPLNRGGYKYSATGIWQYIMTLEQMCGMTVRVTKDIHDTCYTVQQIHRWWEKDWEKHTGHLQMHKQGPERAALGVRKPSLLRRMASELPGVGWKRSLEVERRFGTIECLMLATETELMEIEGIGKVTAREMYKAMHEQAEE